MCFHPKQAHQNRISVSGSVRLIKTLLHLRSPGCSCCRFLRNATVKPYLQSIQTLHLVRECLTYQKTLICTDLPSRAPTVSFCDGLFSQTHILSTLTTTVLSALTSRLGRLNAMNGAAVLLRFCVQLGSNYFNYTAAAFRLMFGSCYVC